MTPTSAHTSAQPLDPALSARQGGPTALAQALSASRRDTLATFAAYETALPGLRVPQRPGLNPPLWELGHIGWFQEWWVLRLPLAERERGHRANPEAARTPPRRPDADALYDSSHVPHEFRWRLPLPTAEATRADLEAGLAGSLAALQRMTATGTEPGDDALYMHRLALLHEDMHHEAALYMAQGLGIAIDDGRWQASALPEPPPPLEFSAARWPMGHASDAGRASNAGNASRSAPGGFLFDNECGTAEASLADYAIDAQVCRWADYLPFVHAGGYDEPRWWSETGWAWRQALPARRGEAAPRYLRHADAAASAQERHPQHRPHQQPRPQWQQWRHGRWRELDLAQPACHLTLHEAEAWCRWAGRRLPTEAEWERAACSEPNRFHWGQVWEWTASPFEPFAGFTPHPYRDYSAPWFDGRPVLRGASFMTQPRMKHVHYRNFFQPQRNDVPAGFRSCSSR